MNAQMWVSCWGQWDALAQLPKLKRLTLDNNPMSEKCRQQCLELCGENNVVSSPRGSALLRDLGQGLLVSLTCANPFSCHHRSGRGCHPQGQDAPLPDAERSRSSCASDIQFGGWYLEKWVGRFPGPPNQKFPPAGVLNGSVCYAVSVISMWTCLQDIPSLVIPGLYIGGMVSAENPSLLKSLGVTHILICAVQLQPRFPNLFR